MFKPFTLYQQSSPSGGGHLVAGGCSHSSPQLCCAYVILRPSHVSPAQDPPTTTHTHTHTHTHTPCARFPPRADHSQRHISAPARDALHDRHPGLHKPNGVGARGMVRRGLVQEWRAAWCWRGSEGKGEMVSATAYRPSVCTQSCVPLCIYVAGRIATPATSQMPKLSHCVGSIQRWVVRPGGSPGVHDNHCCGLGRYLPCCTVVFTVYSFAFIV